MVLERIYKGVLPGLKPPEAVHLGVLRSLETAGNKGVGRTNFGEIFGAKVEGEECLATTVDGIRYACPIGLAGGMDKRGVGIEAFRAIGFGFMEIGTVTPNQRNGNKIIYREEESGFLWLGRILRDGKGSSINRLGFPNDGATATRERLDKIAPVLNEWPVWLNIGADLEVRKDPKEYKRQIRSVMETLWLRTMSKMVFTDSCPNGNVTAGLDGSLRMIEFFGEEIKRLNQQRGTNVGGVVKISPDHKTQDFMPIVEVAQRSGIEAIVATNTTTDRSSEGREGLAYLKKGGIGGRLLYPKSLRTIEGVRNANEKIGGRRLTIVGLGGIEGARQVLEMEQAGADLFEVLTGFVYNPWIIRDIKRDLIEKGWRPGVST